jgi:hypothetical protein
MRLQPFVRAAAPVPLDLNAESVCSRPAAQIQSGERVKCARVEKDIYMQTGFFDGQKGVDK